MRFEIHNRLALITEHIMNLLKKLDESSVTNLPSYFTKSRKKASEKVQRSLYLLYKNNNEICNCKKSQYYSKLYGIGLPCIHTILYKN